MPAGLQRRLEPTLDALALLEHAGLRIVGVDAATGLAAGALRARHYDRQTSPLSIADRVALGTAIRLNEPLATSDPPLARVVSAENGTVVALPDFTTVEAARQPKASLRYHQAHIPDERASSQKETRRICSLGAGPRGTHRESVTDRRAAHRRRTDITILIGSWRGERRRRPPAGAPDDRDLSLVAGSRR